MLVVMLVITLCACEILTENSSPEQSSESSVSYEITDSRARI